MSPPPDTDPVALRPIEDLTLGAGAAESLKLAGIFHVGDLLQRSADELLAKHAIAPVVVAEIPKTASGKVLRRQLRTQFFDLDTPARNGLNRKATDTDALPQDG